MVILPGVDSKSYWEVLLRGQPLPEIACPDPSCSGRLKADGWYARYLGGECVKLRRSVCDRCRVSHALLPEDVCAYRDLTLPALEQALEHPESPSAAAEAAGQEGPAAVRRARRWLRGSSWVGLGFLLPAAGELWERVEALVGAGFGKLLRLRHWLWSRAGYLLGGPSGLFRHGRPGRANRGSPP